METPAKTALAPLAAQPQAPRKEHLTSTVDIYQPQDFSLTDFAPGSRVLVVGCGEGEQLRQLLARGCLAVGTDVAQERVEALIRDGHDIRVAPAEALPFVSASFDGVVCAGALAATDERKAIAEWNRVLVPGGQIKFSCQGFGHGLLCFAKASDWRTCVYGARMVANTWVYRLTGLRLPGWLGTDLCQSESRLATYYAQHGLHLLRRFVSTRRYMSQPVFIYHHLEKPMGSRARAAH